MLAHKLLREASVLVVYYDVVCDWGCVDNFFCGGAGGHLLCNVYTRESWCRSCSVGWIHLRGGLIN